MKFSANALAVRKPRSLKISKTSIFEVISAIFILLFLYTALSKSFDIKSTVNVLRRTPVIQNYPVEGAWAIVGIEYIVSLLLFFNLTRKAGFYSTFFLMIGFTLYIAYMKIFFPKLPCSCGGIISKLSWTEHLILNILLIVLATVGIYLNKKSRPNSNLK